jgi:hypothetical protein
VLCCARSPTNCGEWNSPTFRYLKSVCQDDVAGAMLALVGLELTPLRFDNPPMPFGDDGTDRGRRQSRRFFGGACPAALLSELPTEQRRRFVLSVTGDGAGETCNFFIRGLFLGGHQRNTNLALTRPPLSETTPRCAVLRPP